MMETLIAMGVLAVVAISLLIALLIVVSRKPQNADRDYGMAIYKATHASYNKGREVGAKEQQVMDLETQWLSLDPSGNKRWPGPAQFQPPLKDEVPYEDEEQDRATMPMPDGTDAVVEVTEAPRT